MDTDTAALPDRPIGWWLKEADIALERAFAEALGDVGLSRRDWQALATVAAGPAGRVQVRAGLAGFADTAQVDAVVDGLVARGWVTDGDPLTLTDEGRTVRAVLAGRVGAVRQRVATALPDGDHDMLVRLLARLVAAVR